ncbi:MFS transporter [Streptomyces sp. NPDC001941]|uniref:MFS transporter n=1 Tax=Streptomyces sp. NPDC001941 TaxID=3154659 RepID=UPI00331DA882
MPSKPSPAATLPSLPKRDRITGAVRAAVTEAVVNAYLGPRQLNVQQIADETGRSYCFIYGLLREADTPLRPKGGLLPRLPQDTASDQATTPHGADGRISSAHQRVAALLLLDWSNPSIAAHLGLQLTTINGHLAAMRRRLGCPPRSTRAVLAHALLTHQQVPPPRLPHRDIELTGHERRLLLAIGEHTTACAIAATLSLPVQEVAHAAAALRTKAQVSSDLELIVRGHALHLIGPSHQQDDDHAADHPRPPPGSVAPRGTAYAPHPVSTSRRHRTSGPQMTAAPPTPITPHPHGDVRGPSPLATFTTGEATSAAGTACTAVALPVIAITLLHATPLQVAVLGLLAMLPALALSLPAGAIGDRYPKPRIMALADVASALTVTAVPACWALGALGMPVLYLTVILLGALRVLHQAAAIAVVPELVPAHRVAHANSTVSGTSSATGSAGTYLAAVLVSVLGAAQALLLDAVSYLVGALCAARTRPPHTCARAVKAPVRDGIAFIWQHPLLRPLYGALGLHSYAYSIITTYVAYQLLTVLHTGSLGLGLIMGSGAAGAVAGAFLAPWAEHRFGLYALSQAAFVLYLPAAVLLLAASPGPWSVALLSLAQALQMVVSAAAGLTQRSVRHRITPAQVQSRVQQTAVWVVSGIRPLGVVTAALIATTLDVRTALWAGTLLLLLPPLLLAASPVRRLSPSAPPRSALAS